MSRRSACSLSDSCTRIRRRRSGVLCRKFSGESSCAVSQPAEAGATESAWIASAVSTTLASCPFTLLENPPFPRGGRSAASPTILGGHEVGIRGGVVQDAYRARTAQAVEWMARVQSAGDRRERALVRPVRHVLEPLQLGEQIDALAAGGRDLVAVPRGDVGHDEARVVDGRVLHAVTRSRHEVGALQVHEGTLALDPPCARALPLALGDHAEDRPGGVLGRGEAPAVASASSAGSRKRASCIWCVGRRLSWRRPRSPRTTPR